MARSIAGLKSALDASVRGKAQPSEIEPAVPAVKNAPRFGKKHVGAWLPVAYKASLRLIQAKTERTIEQLTAEALNDLFVKYDVPTVSDRE